MSKIRVIGEDSFYFFSGISSSVSAVAWKKLLTSSGELKRKKWVHLSNGRYEFWCDNVFPGGKPYKHIRFPYFCIAISSPVNVPQVDLIMINKSETRVDIGQILYPSSLQYSLPREDVPDEDLAHLTNDELRRILVQLAHSELVARAA